MIFIGIGIKSKISQPNEIKRHCIYSLILLNYQANILNIITSNNPKIIINNETLYSYPLLCGLNPLKQEYFHYVIRDKI